MSKLLTFTSKDGSQTIPLNATFPAVCTSINTCNQPTATVDGLGNETDYAYYDWGGVQSVLGPAVNGGRPLARFFYSQLYAYVKNASGRLCRQTPQSGALPKRSNVNRQRTPQEPPAGRVPMKS